MLFCVAFLFKSFDAAVIDTFALNRNIIWSKTDIFSLESEKKKIHLCNGVYMFYR